MYTDPNLTSLYCVFDLPFHLALPDSSEQVPEIYLALDPPCGITTQRTANDRGGVVAHGEIIGGDPYGRVSYTTIQVRYAREATPSLENWNDDALISKSVSAAHHLIEHYRNLYDKPNLSFPSVSDLVHFKIVFEVEGREPFVRSVAKPHGPLEFGFNEESHQKFNTLRSYLEQPDLRVEFLRTIQLERDRYGMLGDFAMSVVLSAILFEAWIKTFLSNALQNQGATQDEITNHFVGPRGPYSITRVVRNAIPDVLGFDFAETNEFQNWATDCRDLRNEIVHGNRVTITRQEAEQAALAAGHANAYINARNRD